MKETCTKNYPIYIMCDIIDPFRIRLKLEFDNYRVLIQKVQIQNIILSFGQ